MSKEFDEAIEAQFNRMKVKRLKLEEDTLDFQILKQKVESKKFRMSNKTILEIT